MRDNIQIQGADVKVIGKRGIHLLHGGTIGVIPSAEFVIARHLSRLVAEAPESKRVRRATCQLGVPARPVSGGSNHAPPASTAPF
jgi:hypothetical protein